MTTRPRTKAARLRRAFKAGMGITKAAQLAGCTERYAYMVGIGSGYFKPTRPGRPKDNVLRQAIVDGYAKGLLPAIIAAATGSTPASVRVLASRLGVTNDRKGAVDLRRGFAVPLELLADYRNIMRKGIRAGVAAQMLGIIP
jgi:hypothetical protein